MVLRTIEDYSTPCYGNKTRRKRNAYVSSSPRINSGILSQCSKSLLFIIARNKYKGNIQEIFHDLLEVLF